jgi:hypothetical protein
MDGFAGAARDRPAGQATGRDKVFISYSHKDQEWLERLQIHLTPMVRQDRLQVWTDRQIGSGDWRRQAMEALATARVAVLLVSPHFLASQFITEVELPLILEAARDKDLTIIWACINHCAHEESPLVDFQAAHNIAEPLASLSEAGWNLVMKRMCQQIKVAAGPGAGPEAAARGRRVQGS